MFTVGRNSMLASRLPSRAARLGVIQRKQPASTWDAPRTGLDHETQARAQASHITRDHCGRIRCNFTPGAAADQDTVQYAIQTAGFLIPRSTTMSLSDWAERISQHIQGDPRVAEVCAALRRCQ